MMIDRTEKRLVLFWAILVGITLFSWESGWLQDARIQAGLIIILAMVKVRFVILEFMEIRHAPPLLRIALEAWAVIIGIAMIGMILSAA
jgi:protein-S-isoprenylcysteine O-methyltransferase Ste14